MALSKFSKVTAVLVIAAAAGLFYVKRPCLRTACQKGENSNLIEFNNISATCELNSPSSLAFYEKGLCAFNGSPEIGAFLISLKQTYHIDTAVETGTFLGSTSAFLGLLFNDVHTVEVSESNFKQAQENLHNFKNIKLHLGSSEKVLTQILPELKDKVVLFYLDAHWEKYWPILDELETIAQTHKDNCVILVDDVKVPGHSEISYDSYEGVDLSYDYLKEKLMKVFTKHAIYYLLPRNKDSRAKLLIVPTPLG